MKEICGYIAEAESICLYFDGESACYANDTAEYADLMQAWEEMTAHAVQMPAFGVSIDRLTKEEMRSGLWVEFAFPCGHTCAGMPFEALLFKAEAGYKGFNLIRKNGGKYEGRCYYLDLREGDMSGFCGVAGALRKK